MQQNLVALTSQANQMLVERLRAFGNEPSHDHRVMLEGLTQLYTQLASGEKSGRFAYPMGTGFGKTQSVVCWASAMVQQGLDYGIAICASKVEALCEVKRELVALEVPEERIGLFHSYRYDSERAEKFLRHGEALPAGYASEPATQNQQQRQILLLTHNRVRDDRPERPWQREYSTYMGKPRGLYVWDESFFKCSSFSFSIFYLRELLSLLMLRTDRDSQVQIEAQAVSAWLRECSLRWFEEEQRLDDGYEHTALEFEPPSAEVLKACKVLCRALSGDHPKHASLLGKFSAQAGSPMRLANTRQGQFLVGYDTVVPEEIPSLVVLDASYLVRDLEQMDSDLDNSFEAGMRRCPVSYHKVKINYMKHGAGRTSVSKLFKEKSLGKRLISQEIAEVLKEMPADEGVLIFTFLDRDGLQYRNTLLRDLDALGIDIAAQTQVNDKALPRINTLTWGDETSHSRFSYCKNIIFAGMLHRSHSDIAAEIAGQCDNLTVPMTADQIDRVVLSEVAHSTYQALCRGACRKIYGAESAPMNAWVFHHDDRIKTLINQVMPGAVWKEWRPKFMKPSGRTEAVAGAIAEYLSSTPAPERTISSIKLKREAGLNEVPTTTFKEARKLFLQDNQEWAFKGRSFVRKDGEFYGFTNRIKDISPKETVCYGKNVFISSKSQPEASL